jgi:hypothetical protein
MRDEEERAPKCPYCIGPIADGASKCRHCASDIEWFEFEGSQHTCKVGEGVQIVADLRAEKERLQAEREEQLRRAIEECPSCKKCGAPNSAESIEALGIFTEEYVCFACQKKADDVARGVLGVLTIILTLFLLWVLISQN